MTPVRLVLVPLVALAIGLAGCGSSSSPGSRQRALPGTGPVPSTPVGQRSASTPNAPAVKPSTAIDSPAGRSYILRQLTRRRLAPAQYSAVTRCVIAGLAQMGERTFAELQSHPGALHQVSSACVARALSGH